MIMEPIAFLLLNLPAVLLVFALVLGAASQPRRLGAASCFLGRVLLLPIGVTGLLAGIAHVVFPHLAAAHSGCEGSPFQCEVGMADLAVGVAARTIGKACPRNRNSLNIGENGAVEWKLD
jgi:hypothetical protein